MVEQAQVSVGHVVQPKIAARRRFTWLRRDPFATMCALFLVLLVFGAVAAPWLSSRSPTQPNVRERLQTPSLAHPMGTDELGRDILTRILYGAQPILITGCVSVALAVLIGSTIGGLAGVRGGRTDAWLMRMMDGLISFPALLLSILVVAALGPGLLNVIIAITCALVPLVARLTRASVLVVMQQEYIRAAEALGLAGTRIGLRHVLPNIVAPLAVQATALLATAFATSAALNFLGLGIEPPQPDWGLMVAEGQRLVFDAPHVPFFPGLVIALTVLSVNVLGDALGDALDPLLRR